MYHSLLRKPGDGASRATYALPVRCTRVRLPMKLFPRSIVFLIAGITASAAIGRTESAPGVRERKVDVGEGVSLHVVEAGTTGPGPTLVFIPAGARAPISGDNRSIVLHPLIA